MSRQERKRVLTGPWRKLHGAIWLIGLAILFWKGWIFPGILVLIAISAALEAIIMIVAPGSYAEEEPTEKLPNTQAPAATPVPEHRAELLPSVCPKCGAPVRTHEVRWTGPQSADCSYCGANLPMGTAQPASQ